MGSVVCGGYLGAGWLILAPLILVALGLAVAAGVIAAAPWRDGRAAAAAGPRSGLSLGELFARGDLSQRQYQEALVGILKERYVRGELDLEEYKARLEVLLQEQV